MKKVFQTRTGDPEGNCFAACVASILECNLSDLPDLMDLPEGRNWLEWFNEGLEARGYGVFNAPASPENPFIGYIPEGVHFIAAGPGRRGMKHCVVMQSNGGRMDKLDEFVHDPYHGGQGLESITSICLILKR